MSRNYRSQRHSTDLKRLSTAHEAKNAYPANPRLIRGFPDGLALSQQRLVAFNRILANYWKYQCPHLVRECSQGQLLDPSRIAALNKQMSAILEMTDPNLFPEELRQVRYKPTSCPVPAPKLSKLPKPEPDEAGLDADDNDESQSAQEGETQPVAEPEAFGDDDYAYNRISDDDDEDDLSCDHNDNV